VQAQFVRKELIVTRFEHAGDSSKSSLEKVQAVLRDSQLVSDALAGSSDAFAELQRLYSGNLYCTIFRITRNREDAEDALQDTFLRAYLALGKFEGRSSFYSWLTRIAINSALMILRKRRAHPEMPFDAPRESENDILQFEFKDPAPDPEQVYDQRQRCVNIQREIKKLRFKLRGPILQVAHGSSLKEIARALDISEAAVKSRLSRARARINAARGLMGAEEKRYVSSGLQRKGLIPGLQNREQSCVNSGPYS
jgi:RNA polymerase sigma-70 factor (ECF subfamily)